MSTQAIARARQLLGSSRVRHKITFLNGSVNSMGLQHNSFDRVYSFCVLEHVHELPDVLAEIVQLLKPGGSLHVSVDSLGGAMDPTLVEKHRRDHGVVQYFTSVSLAEQLEGAGLEMLEVLPIFKGKFRVR